MSIRSVEAKSETGRSGAKVEFDKSTNTVKITGFYDTYVKLNLRKNEWTLEDFLSILGIDEAIEKKYKRESKNMISSDSKVLEENSNIYTKTKSKKVSASTKEQPIIASDKKPSKSSTSNKKVSKKIAIAPKKPVAVKVTTPKINIPKVKTPKTPKVKVEKTVVSKIRPKKVEFSIADKVFQIELKNLKTPSVYFKFRKEKPNTDKGSVYMFITHAGNRVRFIPKGCNLISEDIFDSNSKELKTEHPKFSDVCKSIDLAVSKCRKAFEDIDNKYKKEPSKYVSKVELEYMKKKILE